MDLEKVFNPSFYRGDCEEWKDGWEFSFDNVSWQKINVPYCPQSKLSGIGYTDFIPVCYYRRNFKVNFGEKRCVLHFGAVDYRSIVYINGQYAYMHVGGFTPFEVDITDFCKDGENELFLTVFDENKDMPFGKQSWKKNSFGCFYTRTTGIWQPVWIEYVHENRVKAFYFYPDVKNVCVTVDLETTGVGKYEIDVLFDGEKVGQVSGNIRYREKVDVRLNKKMLWSIAQGNLYDVKIRFEQDEVYSYFGLREVCYDGYKFLLNGEEVFQKLVLDQGYNPDGIMTPLSVEMMQRDIDLGRALGFNGVRLHQKVFDPRTLYLCDKAGYMVWGEFPSWGLDYSNMDSIGRFLSEWQETIKRDFNHPSIVIWCPINEAWGDWIDPTKKRDIRTVEIAYEFTKKLDTTRPCVDTSGGHHGTKTDLFDFHCYESIDKIKTYLDVLEKDGILDVPLLYSDNKEKSRYNGKLPVNISECGGIPFGCKNAGKETETVNEGAVLSEESWGYGKGETDGDAFVRRYKELMDLIFSCKKLSGMCYTQLYDLEQEQNGFYNYDRTDKLTEKQKAEIRKINACR